MTLKLELPMELGAALADAAAREGVSVEDYALRLLSAAQAGAQPVQTGADLIAYWTREGLIGSRPDIADSQSQARSIREAAERRGQ